MRARPAGPSTGLWPRAPLQPPYTTHAYASAISFRSSPSHVPSEVKVVVELYDLVCEPIVPSLLLTPLGGSLWHVA